MNKNITKIWISRTDKIGDMLVSIPVFFRLHQMYPQAEITVLGNSYNLDLIKNLPYIHDTIAVDQINFENLVKRSKTENIDIFIALFTNFNIACLAFLSRAKIRITNYSKFYSYFLFNKGLRQNRSKSIQHETEYGLELLEILDSKRYQETENFWNNQIFLSPENIEIANEFYRLNGIENPIIIHIFNGGSAENLTEDHYISFLRTLNKKISLPFLLIGQKNQEEKLKDFVKKCQISNIFIYANEGSILNLAAIIEKAAVYIGTSTGPTHIANSLKCKILALYPCNLPQTSVKRWGLLGNKNVKYIFPDVKESKNIDKRNSYFKHYDTEVEQEMVEGVLELLTQKT